MTGAPGAAGVRLDAVLEAVTSGVALVDAGGRVGRANARWARILGLAEGEDAGRPWQGAIHPDDREPAGWIHASPEPVEVRVVRPSGEVRWASVVWRALPEGGAVVVLDDVTEERRLEAERSALHRVAEAVARGEETGRLFDLVAEELAWLVDSDGAGVARFEDADWARPVGHWTVSADLEARAPARLPLHGQGTTARVFATGRPARADYPEDDPSVPWRSSAAAPIRVEGRLWGALGVVSITAGGLSDDAEERIARFAELVGVAVSNASARELLLRQAATDPLTGLAHHGAFHEALADEARRAARYVHPLSLAIIDLDHFKAVNDGHGHTAGDDVLRHVAELLRDHARSIDVTGRVGGEEFAWLMPQTAVAGAAAGAERLRGEISRGPIGPVARLTASFGVAQLTAGDPDGSDLFRQADRALYRAKRAGRDRTEAAPPVPPVP